MADGTLTGAGTDDHRRLRADTERWFVRRGVPHLINDYSATGDIWTRATPFLSLVLFAELFLAFGDRVSGWSQAGVFVIGVMFVIGAFAVVNRLRRRPALSLPDDIGWMELSAFVLVPAVLPAVVNEDSPVGALVLAILTNVVVLGVTYVTVSYGLVPLIRWSAVRFFQALSGLIDLLGKTLPLLLLFSAFLVLNAEMWQVAHDLPTPFFALVVAMLVLLGSGFVALSLRKERADEQHFGSWAEVVACCASSPLADVAPTDPAGTVDLPPLDRSTERNLSLMRFVGVAIQVLLVAVLVTAFYVLFELLTVREATILQWIAADALDPSRDVWWRATLLGDDVVLTRAHVVVAGFVGTFSGLQFAVSVLTDATYREQFAADVADDVREILAVRALYLELGQLEPDR
ncbi:hypothetical protein [Actinospongicola halichondriae]|uniref:hypothetical protein n=1 Tax=Actinospongicola halichondriae TaxID=3236844 RepID=UPI003D54702E